MVGCSCCSFCLVVECSCYCFAFFLVVDRLYHIWHRECFLFIYLGSTIKPWHVSLVQMLGSLVIFILILSLFCLILFSLWLKVLSFWFYLLKVWGLDLLRLGFPKLLMAITVSSCIGDCTGRNTRRNGHLIDELYHKFSTVSQQNVLLRCNLNKVHLNC